MKKNLYIAAGCLSLVLGIIGIFVPVLPTTPFLLLTAWLWLRSSQRLYDWLMSHPHLGKYIRDYVENKVIPARVKAYTLILLWASMLFCIFYVLPGRLWLQLLLALIAIGVSIHILSLRNRKR